jgi:hypothetical protein
MRLQLTGKVEPENQFNGSKSKFQREQLRAVPLSSNGELYSVIETPPSAVRTLRNLICWQYVKIISGSAGIGKSHYGFIMDHFKKLSSEDVWHREMGSGYEDEDICTPCYQKFQSEHSKKEPATTKPDSETAEHPASKSDIRVILQTAALQIKTLRLLPLDQRIAKLEESLAEKWDCAPGMEPAMEAYRGALQKELDNAKATRDHAAQTSKG